MKLLVLGFVVVAWVLGGCSTNVATKGEYIETCWVDRIVLDKPEHLQFKAQYDTVALDNDVAGLIQNVKAGVDFLVVFGTWCPDSRREVPLLAAPSSQNGIPNDTILWVSGRSRCRYG